jgi:hypothetical protein
MKQIGGVSDEDAKKVVGRAPQSRRPTGQPWRQRRATRANVARTVANFGASRTARFADAQCPVLSKRAGAISLKPMKPTSPNRSMIPCYATDGTSLGHRTLAAAERLVAGGYVRPAYGRKGHLRAIWLLRDDGTSPVQSRASTGTRYSYIESLATGRCWQLRRLEQRDTTTTDGSPVTVRDAFLQVVRDCMASPPETMAARALPERLIGHRVGG